MKDLNNPYVIITGASAGLGKEFALECAKRGFNLILASLPNSGLNEICKEISTNYKVDCVTYEIDLIDDKSIDVFYKWVIDNYSIFMLINNAGLGGSIPFKEASIDYIDNMILLNVRTTTKLTRMFLPQLLEKENAYILNVSSLAAFNPMPYKSVYSASKAFIYYLSRGLSMELKNTSVKVTVLNPGAIPTNDEVKNRIEKIGFAGRLSVVKIADVAEMSINALLKGKSLVIPGFMNKLSFVLMKIVPTSYHLRIAAKMFQKEFKNK